ncbi:MAG: DUF2059 domain-containing protein [Pseudomonas sp.]
MRILVLLGICSTLLLSPAWADDASHRASAERFLRLANADGMTAPVYQQVARLLTAQFSQMGGSMQYESILREYQARAKAELDQELAWEAMRDELIELYLPVFTEEEFEQLADFYESEVGRKLMQHLPELTRDSMAISRDRVEEKVGPRIQALVDEMGEEVEARQAGLR